MKLLFPPTTIGEKLQLTHNYVSRCTCQHLYSPGFFRLLSGGMTLKAMLQNMFATKLIMRIYPEQISFVLFESERRQVKVEEFSQSLLVFLFKINSPCHIFLFIQLIVFIIHKNQTSHKCSIETVRSQNNYLPQFRHAPGSDAFKFRNLNLNSKTELSNIKVHTLIQIDLCIAISNDDEETITKPFG